MTAAEAMAPVLRQAGARRTYVVPGIGSVFDLIEAGRLIDVVRGKITAGGLAAPRDLDPSRLG